VAVPSRLWLVTAAPFAVVGSIVDEYGLRAGLNCPFASWSLGLAGSFERVAAAGELGWGGLVGSPEADRSSIAGGRRSRSRRPPAMVRHASSCSVCWRTVSESNQSALRAIALRG
jgi:hypothetical protein